MKYFGMQNNFMGLLHPSINTYLLSAYCVLSLMNNFLNVVTSALIFHCLFVSVGLDKLSIGKAVYMSKWNVFSFFKSQPIICH